MEPTIAATVLFSAILHPLRELLLKGNTYKECGYLAVSLVWLLAALGQIAVFGGDFFSGFSVWPLVLLSAGGLFAYYYGIILTLRSGDLSVYYPIIRSSPVIVVLIGWAVLGQSYGLPLLLGIGAVLIGAFFLQYRGGRRLIDVPATLATALIAMFGTGIYTVADAQAMRTVEPASFLFATYTVLPVWMFVFFAWRTPRERTVLGHLFGGWSHSAWRYGAAGVISYGSYLLILTAFRSGADMAAVSSLRQLSIPVSVLLAVLFLREGLLARRFAWSLLVAGGIALVVMAP